MRPKRNFAQIGGRGFLRLWQVWVALTPGELKLAGRLLPRHNSAQIGGRAFWELWGLRRQQTGLWLRHQGNLDHSWGKGLIMDLGSDEFSSRSFRVEWPIYLPSFSSSSYETGHELSLLFFIG